uniref:Histone-lysine N-methyltransferase SETMAR n=1 Tax=Strongyloides papillosus TaxID=174720 RepID=A0A0N5BJA9_STREA
MLPKRDIRAIMLNEFKRDLVSHATIKRLFKKLRESSEDLDNEEHRRSETIFDNDELRKAVEANPRAIIRELVEELNISKTTVSDYLKEIGKTKKFDKWVSHDLNDYKKLHCHRVCSSLILRNKNDPFFDRLITCDKKWIFYDNRKRFKQWLDKDEAPKQFTGPKLSPKKVMKLRKLRYETLPHPAYSLDLSPTDYHFFKHLNNFLTEKIFRNDEDAKTVFKALIESRSPDFYADGIIKLVSRLQQCIDCNDFYLK